MNLAFVLSISVAAAFGSGVAMAANNTTTAVATDSESAFGSAEGFLTLPSFNSIRHTESPKDFGMKIKRQDFGNGLLTQDDIDMMWADAAAFEYEVSIISRHVEYSLLLL